MTASTDSDRPRLSVTACYGAAWQAFSGWWIPLTALATAVVVLQLFPRILALDLVERWGRALGALLAALRSEDIPAAERTAQAVRELSAAIGLRVATWTLVLLPVLALLTVLLLLFAWRAVEARTGRNRGLGPYSRARQPPLRLLYISLVHAGLAVAKLAATLLLVIPGLYLYVRLMFVSLVMLEDRSAGAARAARASWRLSRGNFWSLLLLVLMNTGVQLLAAPSILGLIPATGFASAARASAFTLLHGRSEPDDRG